MMKKLWKFLTIFFILSIIPIKSVTASNTPLTSNAQLFAGAAAVDFDMPKGVPVAGYGGGARRNLDPFINPSPYAHYFKASKGVSDPVRAKALVLQRGNTKLVWISVDLVAVSPRFIDYVADKASALGFTKENIFISATHTHSGPGAFADNKFWALVALDRFNQKVFDHMAGKILWAVEMANSKLAPANLGTAEVQIDHVTLNRRKAPFLDPVATVLRVDGTDGSPIATAFNFPIHGTVQGMSNLYLSGDVPGAIERSVEKQTGSVALFLNGAEGDVSPTGGQTVPDPWQRAQVIGGIIGDAISKTRSSITPHAPNKLGYVSYNQPLPGAKLNVVNCFKTREQDDEGVFINLNQFFPRSAPFHGVIIDDTAFVTIPGEAITELGISMKNFGHQLGFGKVGIVGLTNEYLGYILTPAEYKLGGEEGCGSMYGSKLGNWVVEAADKVLTALSLL